MSALEPLNLDSIAVDRVGSARARGVPSGVGGATKRVMDVCIALVALIILAPLMIVVFLIIKMTMGGPVIFGHDRVGLNGRTFRCLKFRSMVRDAEQVLREHLANSPEAAEEWRQTRKLKDDPRVTRLGRVLRKSSIDELPQLFNVLRGEMSCVGPRPIVMDELERYGVNAGDYLAALPGLTGLWQVSGRSALSYDERVALDGLYVRTWSFQKDMIILLKTIPSVLHFDQTA